VTGNDNNRDLGAIGSFETLWGGGNMFHDSSSSSIINGEGQWRQGRNKDLEKKPMAVEERLKKPGRLN
jgi:hypothetical protein